MWNTNKLRSGVVGAALAGTMLVAAVVVLIVSARAIASETPPTPAASAEILLVEHTYDGPLERAGVLMHWQYTGGRMLVEWSDTTTDGVFRNAFEDLP